MGRIIYKCEFGFVHNESTCRCQSDHIETRQVKCNKVDEHGGSSILVGSPTKDLYDRLQETVDNFFGPTVTPLVKTVLIQQLEHDVIVWLTDTEIRD